jgi:hypothetical protein
MKKAAWSALILVLAGTGGVAAAAEEPAETELTVSNRTHATVRASFGGPLGATVTGEMLCGLGADIRDEEDRVKGLAGLLVQIHAGSGGGKLSLGAGGQARVQTDDFKGTVSAGLKISLARTWGLPIGTESGLTYLGPELDLSVMRVALSLGPLWRINGARGKSVLFTWAIGVRL